MNLPNKLTVIRIGLTLLMAILLTVTSFPFSRTLALVVFVLAVLTDYWDGALARSRNLISAFGQLMDPMADKILVCAAFISFVAIDQIVPAWIAIIVISREFMVTGLRMLAIRQGLVVPAGVWGKHKMIWQTILIVWILVGLAVRDDWFAHTAAAGPLGPLLDLFNLLFEELTPMLALIVAILTLVSGLVYLWQHRELVLKDL